VSALVDPEALVDAAVKEAQALAALPAATFTLTKAHARQPIRDFLGLHAARIDGEVARIWSAAPAQDAIRRYVARTLR